MIGALPRVALQVWIVLFIVFFGAEVVHLEPALRITTQVLFGIPLAAWAAWRLRGPVDGLEWIVVGLLGLFAIVCLLSRDRTESLGTLGLASAYAAWFLLMRRGEQFGWREPVVLAAATGLAITLAFNAYLLIQEKVAWLTTIGAAPFEGLATFPWESVNALPAVVIVAIPFVAWLPRGVVRTVLAIVIGLSAVVVVPLSMGRAGWLGLGVAGLGVAILHPGTSRLVARVPQRRRVAAGAGAGMVALLGLVLIGPRVVTAIAESGRLLLWQQDLAMAAGSALVGSGPGAYSWVRLDSPPATADLLAVRLTHSVPLQTLVDGGLLLVVGSLAVAAAWGWSARQRVSSWSWADRIAASCLAGFLAAAMLDDFSYLPAVIAAALAVAAFLVPVTKTASSQRRWFLPSVLGAAALIAVPNVVAVDVARASAQAGRTHMVRGEYTRAAAAFEQATSAHPENGGYWLGLGMADAWAGDGRGALSAYERAATVAPGDPRAYAAIAELDPDADRAALLRQAADRTLGDPQYAIRLGAALAEVGQFDDATHAWARAVALQPELLRLLPYDGTEITMEAVADDAALIIAAEPRPSPVENQTKLWDIALALDRLPAEAGTAWQAVDAARHDGADAAELAHRVVEEAPTDQRSYQAAAAVAAFACDAEGQHEALELEEATGKGWQPRPPEPQARREFVFREASLGPSQPPSVGTGVEIPRWPWALIDKPTGCS